MEEKNTATPETVTEFLNNSAKIQNNSDRTNKLKELVNNFWENPAAFQISNIPDEEESPSLFKMNGVDVIPVCSINIVAAQKKSGKSNFAGLLMAACASTNHQVLNGAIRNNLENQKVLNIDTEQPLRDARRILRRVMKTIGFDYNEKWEQHNIYSISVKDYYEEERRIIIETAISYHQPTLVIIDGIADLVSSVNDECENKNLMKWLDYLSNKYNCAVVGMLHLNYGTGKIGGWSGTQANKKFTDSFILKKDKSKGFFTVTHEGRGMSAPELRFKIVCPSNQNIGWWDSVSNSIPDVSKKNEESELRILIKGITFPCRSGILVSELMKKHSLKSRPTTVAKVSKMVKLGILIKRKVGGNAVEYNLSENANDTHEQGLPLSYSD